MNFKLWHNTRLIFICLLSVFSSISIFGVSQSVAMESAPEKSVVNFEDYFKQVIRYSMAKSCDYEGENCTDQISYQLWDLERINYSITIDRYDIREKIFQNLMKLMPSLSHFYDKMENSLHTYLEILFDVNLGWLAEAICSKIKEANEKLPEKYEILLEIYRGESPEYNFSAYPSEFINLAYRVANNTNNILMVKILYPLTDVEEKEASLKKFNPEIYSPEMNYIHEPYWSYNLIQLRDYGERIINKIRPYFVEETSVKARNGKGSVLTENGRISVREVPFGYVLPNLYLKKRLADENDETRAVARIFLVPKGKNVKFKFQMPYTENGKDMDNKKLKDTTSKNNPLRVYTNDIIVYQEYIDGEPIRDSQEFRDLGHQDFNNEQIIKSNKDNKSYLIDTKEEKNFIIPYFGEFQSDSNRAVVYDAKSLNFDPRIIFVDVTVPLEKNQ